MAEVHRAPEPELEPPRAWENSDPARVALAGANLGWATRAVAATAPVVTVS